MKALIKTKLFHFCHFKTCDGQIWDKNCILGNLVKMADNLKFCLGDQM